ncbi:MAG TPA: YggT family protein [Candidatus Izemoplasmatales bacterium]|nr:YggT family protein [Bacillota bacterium]HRY77620.1 YggT family protein [Candidatus Izemoplasmatales bacterium]
MTVLYQILQYGYLVLYVYYLIIVLKIILSWTPLVKTGFYAFLHKITAPYTDLFHGWLVIGHIDLTPLLGIILYQLILAFIGAAL